LWLIVKVVVGVGAAVVAEVDEVGFYSQKEEWFILTNSDSEDSGSIRYDPAGIISVRQNRIDNFST